MGKLLNAFYCAGYDGYKYPMPLQMIGSATERRSAREAYQDGAKDWKHEEAYLRAIGRIKDSALEQGR